MKRLVAYVGVAAMLVALLTAPFFHIHDRDDHGSPVSLVHAHFGESHVDVDHHGLEFESGQTHTARSIDVYTLSTPSSTFELGVLDEAPLSLPALELADSVIIPELPRSHGPPGLRLHVPRPPPTL
jgi:hypothetical protein